MSAENREIDEKRVEPDRTAEPMIDGDDIEIIGDMAKKLAKEEDPVSEAAEKKQKRTKKVGSKRLAELLDKKNEMLLKMEKQLAQTEQLLEIKENKILRLAAEFENYKKRTRREWELHLKKANAVLLGDILGVLDDFDRAFAASDGAGDHFYSGIRMIHTQLMDILKRAGLSEIEAEGRLFDPQYHEAMGNAESDQLEEGHVLHVVQKGYMINDLLLRPARVIVVKETSKDEPAEKGLENN
ncbi:MAG: nucleotide exchange factor GrpE [Candidatus Krumholzibacteriota bacterium]|nr:nucleotide exchange factor GrpE [Candidatus Krumholzibacteriota bacterium]